MVSSSVASFRRSFSASTYRCPVRLLEACNLVAGTTSDDLSQSLQASLFNARSDPPSPRPSVYVGFDPTAKALHVGNLVSIRALRAFQRAGFRPLALIGGATGFIGDPSGKNRDRVLLDGPTITTNQAGIERCLRRVLDFEASADGAIVGAKLVNNMDWYHDMSAFDFVRDIGRHFRVSQMLGRESVKTRMDSEAGISFTEFTYQMFQANDFHHLYVHEECVLQIGGSDQWGNIAAGVDLIRRQVGGAFKMKMKQANGLTVPLLTTASGEKLGKSAGNAIWLDPDMTSPFDFYQYFMQTTDDDVRRLIPMLAVDLDGLPDSEFSENRAVTVLEEHARNPGKRKAQRFLADAMVHWVHGADEMEKARNATQALFSQRMGGDTDPLQQTLRTALDPVCVTMADTVDQSIVDLAVLVGAAKSKSACRRLIQSGGLYLNQEKVDNVKQILCAADLVDGEFCLLRVGKKKQIVVKISTGV
jgi:tyrosyl-tRNA synthetase